MPSRPVYSILNKKENAHLEPIYCCSWVKLNKSGDSTTSARDFIVTGGLDCLVKVWTLEGNRLELLHTLEGHSMAVVSVAISPAAQAIASSALDSSFILWELASGKKISNIQTGVKDVWDVAFSPDGEAIATGGHTGKIFVHADKNRMLDTRGRFILSIDWSPNGKYIASGSEDGVVCILDISQGKVVHSVNAHEQPIRSIAFSPCGKRLATASNDGYVKLYDVASANYLCSLKHKTWALSVSFSPDGTRIASGAADGSVTIASTDDLAVLNVFKEHSDMVWGVSFSSDSKSLLSVSKDKSINIYECPPKR